jgi:SAM-dependent methyltransferase
MIDVGTCPICDSTSFVEVYSATFTSDNWHEAVPYFLTGRTKAVHGRIMRCASCTFLFTSPQFESHEYAHIYAEVHAAGGTNQPQQARFDMLASRVRRSENSGRFLDFGCGRGAFLDAMGGFDGVGFEISADDVTRNGRIVTGDILSDRLACVGFDRGGFDFIVAWDVLEHLANPSRHIQRLGDLLKPGGRFYLTLPDSSSWVARLTGKKWNMLLLEHLWYFSPATLRQFLARCGLRLEVAESIPYPVDAATIVLRVRQTYGSWIPRPHPLLARFVISLPIGLMFAKASKIED